MIEVRAESGETRPDPEPGQKLPKGSYRRMMVSVRVSAQAGRLAAALLVIWERTEP